MRIAVLIIALCMTRLVGMQSCAIFVGGGLGSDKDMSGAGAVGVLVAFLYVLGAAFVMGLPKVAGTMFAIAALLGLIVGFQSAYIDMRYWGGLAAFLSVMAFAGARRCRNPPLSATERGGTKP